MKGFKYQALVTLYPAGGGESATLGDAPRRMVLRARNNENQHIQVYSALVSCDGGEAIPPGSNHLLVTLRLAGDDVGEYLGIGEHFDLWLGADVGTGVVTRRLYV